MRRRGFVEAPFEFSSFALARRALDRIWSEHLDAEAAVHAAEPCS